MSTAQHILPKAEPPAMEVEIYGHDQREVEQSVNFITCHDGFTLNDVVSYNQKHNEPNGEDSRDGADDNRSWNCGVEGPSTDPAVESLRNRQIKNFLTVTMLSLGVPMIVMGDEMRRTQRGNNAYCQDNEISWLDWNLLSRHADVHRFVKLLVARRRLRRMEHERQRMTLNQLLKSSKHAWHGAKRLQPDWSPSSHSVAFGAELGGGLLHLHVILNAYWEPLIFELPQLDGGWHRWIDTALEPPPGHRRVAGGAARSRRDLPDRCSFHGRTDRRRFENCRGRGGAD